MSVQIVPKTKVKCRPLLILFVLSIPRWMMANDGCPSPPPPLSSFSGLSADFSGMFVKRLCQNVFVLLISAFKSGAFRTCGTSALNINPPSAIASSSRHQKVPLLTAKIKLRTGRPNLLVGRSQQGRTDNEAVGLTSRNMEERTPIRPVRKEDMAALKSVIDATDLFPSGMLDDMVDGYLNGKTEELWLTRLGEDGSPVALMYAKPEEMTEGTWNALLLAVRPDQQRSGFGRELMAHLEGKLKEQGHRLLLVETSGNQEYAGTRAFYERVGYEKEGRIRDFYQAGEDKIIYRKQL